MLVTPDICCVTVAPVEIIEPSETPVVYSSYVQLVVTLWPSTGLIA